MYELKKMERYSRVNLLGPGPLLMENNLPDRGLTKVEKHCCRETVFKCLAANNLLRRWKGMTLAQSRIRLTYLQSM